MDPTADFNSAMRITGLDLQAFDAIGWDLSAAAAARVPEPTSIMLFGLAAAGLLTSRRRKLTLKK